MSYNGSICVARKKYPVISITAAILLAYLILAGSIATAPKQNSPVTSSNYSDLINYGVVNGDDLSICASKFLGKEAATMHRNSGRRSVLVAHHTGAEHFRAACLPGFEVLRPDSLTRVGLRTD